MDNRLATTAKAACTNFYIYIKQVDCGVFVTGAPPLNVVEISPNHVHQKKNVFVHVYEINTGGCVVY